MNAGPRKDWKSKEKFFFCKFILYDAITDT